MKASELQINKLRWYCDQLGLNPDEESKEITNKTVDDLTVEEATKVNQHLIEKYRER